MSSPRDPRPRPSSSGYEVSDLRVGDPWELSEGRLVECLPAGGRHGTGQAHGASIFASDPGAPTVGAEVGFHPDAKTLRAPDLAVGGFTDTPGYVAGVPQLAVEYADRGQDEVDLRRKIDELLQGGTRFVWVVRLVGPQRVEVYERGQATRLATPGQDLTAPGVLVNPVPVQALFDPAAAHEVTLRNLLNRQGYQSLAHVETKNRAEGWAEGKAEGKAEALAEAVLSVLAARGLAVSDGLRERIGAERDPATLARWLVAAATATSAEAAVLPVS